MREEAKFDKLFVLFNLAQKYRLDLSESQLYDATRKHWIVSIQKAQNVIYACAVYQEIIREVYKVDKWIPSDKDTPPGPANRHYFVGTLAEDTIRNRFKGKHVKMGQNPVRYP